MTLDSDKVTGGQMKFKVGDNALAEVTILRVDESEMGINYEIRLTDDWEDPKPVTLWVRQDELHQLQPFKNGEDVSASAISSAKYVGPDPWNYSRSIVDTDGHWYSVATSDLRKHQPQVTVKLDAELVEWALQRRKLHRLAAIDDQHLNGAGKLIKAIAEQCDGQS